MLYAIDNEAVAQIQYADLGDMNEFLVNMTSMNSLPLQNMNMPLSIKSRSRRQPQLTPPVARKKDKTAPLTLLPEIPDTTLSITFLMTCWVSEPEQAVRTKHSRDYSSEKGGG